MDNNMFAKFTPKQNFMLGIATALFVGFAIGFFVLLSAAMRGNDVAAGKTAAINTPPSAAPTVAAAPQPSGDIQLAAITASDWVRGDRQAKVSVVEFSDLECPFCKQFHGTMQRLMSEYNGQVNWVYRHFPLTSLHSKAPKEAEAAECAGELGGNEKFWTFVDRLFAVTPSNNGLDQAQLPEIAGYVGLNKTKFTSCLDSGKYVSKVQDQTTQATIAGGQGTPYSVVVAGTDKIPVSGAVPYEQLKTIIDSALAK